MAKRIKITAYNPSEGYLVLCDFDPCLPCRRDAAAMKIACLAACRLHRTAGGQGRWIAARNICRKFTPVQIITGYVAVR
jgi:hypothetical protein